MFSICLKMKEEKHLNMVGKCDTNQPISSHRLQWQLHFLQNFAFQTIDFPCSSLFLLFVADPVCVKLIILTGLINVALQRKYNYRVSQCSLFVCFGFFLFIFSSWKLRDFIIKGRGGDILGKITALLTSQGYI